LPEWLLSHRAESRAVETPEGSNDQPLRSCRDSGLRSRRSPACNAGCRHGTNDVRPFAKGGTTYGWTEVSAAAGTGVASGDEHGLGLGYGAGLGYEVTRDIQVVGEWDRNRFKFVSGREDVDLFSVGVKLKF
jgi:opacity protein-like surface antigen